MDYIWYYKALIYPDYYTHTGSEFVYGVVSAMNEDDAKQRIYDKYSNFGFGIYEENITVIHSRNYIGYDADHNVLEFVETDR